MSNRKVSGMASWTLQDARARFSELVETSIKRGPQIVTRRGVETAVVVSMEEWRRLQKAARLSLKALLLGPGPRLDGFVIPRRVYRWRRPTVLE